MAECAERRLLFVAGVAAVGLLVLIMLVSPQPSAASQRHSVDYDYKAIGLDYNVGAHMSADRGISACVAGTTGAWNGHVSASVAELSSVDGDGSLTIGRHGSGGFVDAGDSFDFDFTGGERLDTECMNGVTSNYTDYSCTDTATKVINVNGQINGGVGDKVNVVWNFDVDGKGSWVPDTFHCAQEDFIFTGAPCTTKHVPLSTFTQKTFKLEFKHCQTFTFAPPSGSGYDFYEAGSTAHGFVKMKRTHRS